MNQTTIEWTQTVLPDGEKLDGYTFNAWTGCTKISPGCANCYAERMSVRFVHKFGLWGSAFDRKIGGEKSWDQLRKMANECFHKKQRRRVFCFSMADVFDENAPCEVRRRFWQTIIQTSGAVQTAGLGGGGLDYLLLTKRPNRIAEVMTEDKLPDTFWEQNGVWLGVSVENSDYISRIESILKFPALVHFISFEPLLAETSIANILINHTDPLRRVDWVIVGGESGPGARPMHPRWARVLRDECVANDVPFFFKQWGQWVPAETIATEAQMSLLRMGMTAKGLKTMMFSREGGNRRGDRELIPLAWASKKSNNILDGETWQESPMLDYS